MKKTIFLAACLSCALQLYAQFSIRTNVPTMMLGFVEDSDIELMQDNSYSNNRFVFTIQGDLSLAYQVNSWEFSLGMGYQLTQWNQRFDAPLEDVKAFIGSKSLSDSSDVLGKISYSGRYYIVPLGAKYFFDKEAPVSAFLSLQIQPAFAYQRIATAKFFDDGSFLGLRAVSEEDPILQAETEDYFLRQTNSFAMDGKGEFGFRFWGGKSRFSLDLSLGYQHGLVRRQAQMGLPRSVYVSMGLRYVISNKTPSVSAPQSLPNPSE
jgi:hypothetical protein